MVREKWEYKTIVRRRSWDYGKDAKGKRHDWLMEPEEWNINILVELTNLGDEGWELVAVVPRSDSLGGNFKDSYTRDYAGFTTSELWVFKRRQEL
jgi:hypothetical protein